MNEQEDKPVATQTQPAPKAEQKIARPLKVLVPLIKEDLVQLRAAERDAGLPFYRAVGDKLNEAKSQVTKGDWGKWLTKNFELSRHSADLYMNYATEMEVREAFREQRVTGGDRGHGPEPVDFKNLNEFRTKFRGDSPGHRPAWHAPVSQVLGGVDARRLAQQRMQDEAKESRLQQHLAMQLIDIGYRALASKLHPDKPGGSREAMVRLDAVRVALKEATKRDL